MESTRMHGGEGCGAYLRAAKHPALIVFDLDGTIADSRDMARESYKRVFAMMGYGMITDELADSFNGPGRGRGLPRDGHRAGQARAVR